MIVSTENKKHTYIHTYIKLIKQHTNMLLPCNGPEVSSSEKITWCTQGIYKHAPFDWLNESQSEHEAGSYL